jgi:hypothetical protein
MSDKEALLLSICGDTVLGFIGFGEAAFKIAKDPKQEARCLFTNTRFQSPSPAKARSDLLRKWRLMA